MEADAKTHSQTLGGSQRIMQRGGGKIVGAREIKDITKPQNQLTWAHRDPQSLNQQPGSLHETDLHPLHICYSVAWSSCGNPNSGSRAVSESVSCFGNLSFY